MTLFCEKYIIKSLDKEHKIFLKDEITRSNDIYRTATGRILLANMNRDEVKKIYLKHGAPMENEWSGISSYSMLLSRLSEINKKSIMVMSDEIDGEINIGISGAIYKDYQCIGAIGITTKFPENEYESFSKNENHLTEILKKAIVEINRRLSYS